MDTPSTSSSPKSGVKSIIWAVIVIIVVLAIIFLGKGNKTSGQTIKIGGLYIETGPIALLGELEQRGTKLALNRLNSDGGRPVEVITEDTAYDPAKALSAYNLLKSQGVKVFIADGSGPVAAVRPQVVTDGNFVMVPGATTPAFFDGDNKTCRIALTAKNFGPALAGLLQSHDYKKTVFLFPNNEYGKGLAEEFTKAVNANGGEVIDGEFYDATPAANDYRTNITKLKSFQNSADALVFVQVANTVETMIQQIKELGWTKPVFTDHYTIENPALKNRALANGMEFVTYEYSPEGRPTDTEELKQFKAEYRKEYNEDPSYLVAATYDAISIITKAVRQVGDDPQKIANYVSQLKDYSGLTGNLTFNSDCEVSRTTVKRTIQNGKVLDL